MMKESDFNPPPRKRRHARLHLDPPNRVPAGRPTPAPDGLTSFPGPRKLVRFGRHLHIRIDWFGGSPYIPPGWWASVQSNALDSGLVAIANDLHVLQVYLLDRFSPCCWTIVGERPTPPTAA